jgi:hypothetical protein
MHFGSLDGVGGVLQRLHCGTRLGRRPVFLGSQGDPFDGDSLIGAGLALLRATLIGPDLKHVVEAGGTVSSQSFASSGQPDCLL